MVSPLILRFQPEQGRGCLQPAGDEQRGAGHPGQHRQLCGLQAQRGDTLYHPHTPGRGLEYCVGSHIRAVNILLQCDTALEPLKVACDGTVSVMR